MTAQAGDSPDVHKTDAVEAHSLTGETDMKIGLFR